MIPAAPAGAHLSREELEAAPGVPSKVVQGFQPGGDPALGIATGSLIAVSYIAPAAFGLARIRSGRGDIAGAIRALDLGSRSVVLDLACGTGDLCRELAGRGLRPIGVDLSFGMLAAARTHAPLVHADVLLASGRWADAERSLVGGAPSAAAFSRPRGPGTGWAAGPSCRSLPASARCGRAAYPGPGAD